MMIFAYNSIIKFKNIKNFRIYNFHKNTLIRNMSHALIPNENLNIIKHSVKLGLWP